MEIDLPDKLHPKGFWPWPTRTEPGYSELPSLRAGAARGWFEQKGEEKCSVRKPCAAFG